ncbi:hypothetical protein ABKP09_19975 [Peribacillus frigoritolerans]|uniref:hypothetical protein n=1 Tax=Peribacillus frigoritolerans TaxID=450367 RepID=UPI0032B4D361
MKKLLELNIGENLYLQHESKPFTVRAKGGKFLIATGDNGGNCSSYTIIDTEKDLCGPHNKTFNPYDFSKQEDVDQCLEDLIQSKYDIELSKRHGVSIYEALDLVKTLMEVKIFKFSHSEGVEIVAADNAKAAIMHYFTEYQDDLYIDGICMDGIEIEELHGEQITTKHKLFSEFIESVELLSYRDLAVERYKGEPILLVVDLPNKKEELSVNGYIR